MITLKEASEIALEKEPGDSIIYGFEYKNLYIFHMLAKGAEIGSSLNYHLSVNKESKKCDFFNIWDEGYDNPDEFCLAFKKRVKPEDF